MNRSSRVSIERGLYVLRYVDGKLDRALAARLNPSVGSESTVSIIAAPGFEQGHLAGPGSALVVLAHTNAELDLTIDSEDGGSLTDATFQLEKLNSNAPSGGGRSGRDHNVDRGSSQFQLLAHVAYRGDIQVGEGEWAAGPRAPSPIEGLEFHSGVPDVAIETQVLIAGQWSERAPGGVFVGSRGRSQTISGVRLRVVGGSASRHTLEAEALFLGSAIQGKRGSDLEFMALSGAAPLVGLRVGMVAKEPGILSPRPNDASSNGTRVRVFRAPA